MLCSKLLSYSDPAKHQRIQHLVQSYVDEYKHGFGDTDGNYWIGNNVLTWLTGKGKYKLKFDLQSRSTSKWYYAEFSTFRVLSEADNYKLQRAGYSGNAGQDAFSQYHNGQQFTTVDRDNDLWSSRNCAAARGGGFWWWYCGWCNVNAARSTGGFSWDGLPGGEDLKLSRMWLQCK